MTTSWPLVSPNGRVSIEVRLDADSGALLYSIANVDVAVIQDGRLGVVRSDLPFVDCLSCVGATEPTEIQTRYELPHGKQLALAENANERTLSFATTTGERLDVVLRAYNEGVAFRYRFPDEASAEPLTVDREATSFQFAAGGKAWIQATQEGQLHGPAYENYYSDAIPIGEAAAGPGWNLPALFQTNGRWVLLAEADVDENYCGIHLGAEPSGLSYSVELPDAANGNGVGSVEPVGTLPWTLPWRVVLVGSDLAPIVESNMIRHLSRATEPQDFSWVMPGRVSWGWWADPNSPKDLDVLRDYVDLAGEMGWEYSLVDANWDVHSDEEMIALVKYAKVTGVGVLVWYNSGGPNNYVTEAPRDRMYDREVRRAEMERLASWGVAGLKIDFFHSEKQAGVQHFLDILRDAADYKLLIYFHGCTVPRGWSRRWPHLMTMEAVTGAEQYGFLPTFPDRAPVANTILPFTRNVVGAMDYTPVTLSDNTYPRTTTAAHELALGVLFESGLQHFADSAESYRSQTSDVRSYLSNVPAVWDETRFLKGLPGQYAVLARRRGSDWYIAGINGLDEPKSVELQLGTYGATPDSVLTLTDGEDRDDVQAAHSVPNGSVLPIDMAARGGFVVQLTVVDEQR